MQIQTILVVSFFALSTWLLPQESSARSVCGVDVSKSRRCHKELRRLAQACQSQPVLCGLRFQAGMSPDFSKARKRCLRLRRRSKRRWVRGLCGLRLFSPPKTYCGLKGVEVAAACIQSSLGSQKPAPAPVGGVGSSSPTPPRPAPASPSPSGQTPAPAAATPRPAAPAPAARPRPATGQLRLTTPNSSGSSTWLILLQLLTLLGVVYLLYKRASSRNKDNKDWMNPSAWDAPSESWQEFNAPRQEQDDERLLQAFQQMEERIQTWQELQSEQLALLTSPEGDMQAQADALTQYYITLGHKIIQNNGEIDERPSDVRQRLLGARSRLKWLFNAHRELPNQQSPVEELKAASWHHIQRLLETLGHVSWETRVQSHMTNGQFSATDFLQRKAQDQASRYANGEELQSYMTLREEFLSCLETLLRSNLRSLHRACSQRVESLTPDQELAMFFDEYVLEFLLDELPSMLQEVTRRSSPDRSGALVDQFIQFIEGELEEAGVELFPVLDEAMTDTVNTRLIYLLHAGVRLSEAPQSVLRAPDSSVVSAAQEVAASSPSVDPVPAAEVELPGSQDSLENLSFELDLEQGEPGDWFQAPEEEGFFDIQTLHSEPPEGAEAPSIGNPDSDPPERTEESLQSQAPELSASSPSINPDALPTGPLPRIENITQGFEAVPESELSPKVTREYGPHGESKR